MPPRTTLSNLSPPPVAGTTFLAEYATRMKSLFDAAAFPLTAVGGTGNVVTASLDPPLDPGGLVNGMKFTITWGAANTGAVTLAINGGTAVPVVDADNVALGASVLASGRRSLIEFIGGAFRILSSAGGGAAGGGPTYQVFTASGTWTRPTGYDPDTQVLVEVWGAGGSGGASANISVGGGGGGGYSAEFFRIADLPSSVTVTIGAAGAPATNNVGNAGGTTSFGALLSAFGGGGGGGATAGGGGGGELAAGGTGSLSGSTQGVSGPVGGGGGGTDALTIWGGGGGSAGAAIGSRGVYGGGGGGGGAASPFAGGASKFGGSGGAGGNAGTAPAAGSAPGGGGGGRSGTSTLPSGAGARGECRITIFG